MNDDPESPDDALDSESVRDAARPEGTEEAPVDSPDTVTTAPVPSARIPKRIGQYHIKRAIASGGMGTVYEATQERPRRIVALKLMKHGIASRSALRRFEYESQILARLRHPGIAQVYEAGTHRDATGTVPYFAMEYIVGAKPITQYVKEKKLGTRERLDLFGKVCDAVHHGHQKGIIHRDLKPSNILVDATGHVKIIDFGVARSTDSDLAVTTLQTDIGQLIGTLQYMSPEQCEADPHNIDTRSDVYALGVVFYELLCDRLPYDVTRVAMHEATRIIREQQPTKLTTVDKTLKGDIETIALKAVEKDRERRYQSATDFGQDIRRYLNNEAITARPASMMYHFRVLVRRNKPIFVAVAAVFVVLIGATIVSTSLYVRSEQEANKSQTTQSFLEDMLLSVDPYALRGKQLSFEAVLATASTKLDEGELAHVPEVEVDIRNTLGKIYRALKMMPEKERQMSRVRDLCRQLYGENDARTLEAAVWLAGNVPMTPKARIEELSRLAEIAERSLGTHHPVTIEARTVRADAIAHGMSDWNRAEVLIRALLRLDRSLLSADQANRLGCIVRNLGRNRPGKYADDGPPRDSDEALAVGESLGRLAVDLTGPFESPKNLYLHLEYRDSLAFTMLHRGKFEEAERLLRENLEIKRSILRPGHEDYDESLGTLVDSLKAQKESDEANRLAEEYCSAIESVIDEAHSDALVRLGIWYLECEQDGLCDPQRALRFLKIAVERAPQQRTSNWPLSDVFRYLAQAHFMAGDTAEAVETQEKAVSLLAPGESSLRIELEANLAKYRAGLSEQGVVPETGQPGPKEEP